MAGLKLYATPPQGAVSPWAEAHVTPAASAAARAPALINVGRGDLLSEASILDDWSSSTLRAAAPCAMIAFSSSARRITSRG